MANKQINELTELTTASGTDWMLVYDNNEAGSEKSKKITRDNVMPVFSAWVPVAEYNWSNASPNETISWDGETNEEIYITFNGYHNSTPPTIRFNNDSGTNYAAGNIWQDDTVVTAYYGAGATGISVVGGATDTAWSGRMHGFLKNTGKYRLFTITRGTYDSANPDLTFIHLGYRWENSGDNVTSVNITGASITGTLKIFKWHTFGG